MPEIDELLDALEEAVEDDHAREVGEIREKIKALVAPNDDLKIAHAALDEFRDTSNWRRNDMLNVYVWVGDEKKPWHLAARARFPELVQGK